jgi:hypothetical protein
MANNNPLNASNVKGVGGGYVYVAPDGTTLPTDYSTALGSTFKNLGFVSSDGIEPNEEVNSERITDMNGDLVYVAVSSRYETFKLTFIEINEQVLSTLYGATASSGTITSEHKAPTGDSLVFVFELVLRDGRRWRRILPCGQITERKERNLVASTTYGIETTISANADSSGRTVIDYIQETASVTTGD